MAENLKEHFITINGVKCRVRYKYKGIEYAERHLGMAFPKLMIRVAGGVDVTANEWVTLVFSALLQDNPDIKREQVEDAFDYPTLKEWAPSIAEAMKSCMPAEDKAKKKPATQRQ